jgi:hypothetical protein
VIAVLQCAARKQEQAGHLMTRDGRRVLFVAEPAAAPVAEGVFYARPDDLTDENRSWRDQLLAYNHSPGDNPLDLLPAYRLYQNESFQKLVGALGIEKVFVLSAGWGLIAASFLTPNYDITFSAQAESYKRRRKSDHYQDLSMLANVSDEPVLFFGGKDYLPLFSDLTAALDAPRVLFFSSSAAPTVSGVHKIRYPTSTRTNWHYECVRAYLSGALDSEIELALRQS